MSDQIAERKADVSLVRFVPYGAADEIKLSIKIVQNMIAEPTRSGATCTERDALRFIAMCQARKLNPFEGDAFLIGYDGKDGPKFSLITAHQAFLKRAELHPEFDGMESGIVVVEGEDGKPTDISGDFHTALQDVVGGWARVHLKTRKVPIYRRLRLARFDTGRAEWAKDPGGMICKCAEADALRSAFPTMLGGLYMNDEVTLDVAPRRQEGDGSLRLADVVSNAAEEPSRRQTTPSQEEAAEAAAGLAPLPAGRKPPESPLQDQLAAVVTAAGYTFEQWREWALADRHITDPELPDFDLVSDLIAQRCLRAKAGMLSQLAKRKEEIVP